MSCYDCRRFLKLHVYELALQKLKEEGYHINRKLKDEVEKSLNECFKLDREPERLADEVYQVVLNKLHRKK